MTLKELGIKHRTDKATHGYLDAYEALISTIPQVRTVLEIGVRTGASLRMWAEYFPTAGIDGIDIDPNCAIHSDGRIRVFIGDQTDRDFINWSDLWSKYELIIDDGSHVNEWTVKSFEILWPRLASGGIYIIEDMRCTYQDLEAVGVRQKWAGMALVPEIPIQRRQTIVDFIAARTAEIDHHKGGIASLHYSQDSWPW